MKSLFTILICSALTLTVCAANPTEEEALKDWKNLVDVYNSVDDDMDYFRSDCFSYDYEKNLKRIEDLEKNKMDNVNKVLDSFGKKYGTSANDIDNKINSIVKKSVSWRRPGSTYAELKTFADNVKASRKNTAEKLLKDVEANLKRMSFFSESIRAKKYAELKKTLELAHKFDPQNKKVKEKLDGIDKEASSAQDKIEKERDERKWPEPFKNFAGPGNPKKLEAAALKYLQNSKEWGNNPKTKVKILAVRIKGNWWSVEKNLLGQTTQWGLSIYAAIAPEKSKSKNATVYELSMVTAGNKKEPPFVGTTVGDSWVMRRKNLPGGGGAAAGGFFGTIFWLALAFGNIVAGLLAAAPLLKQKAPQLKVVYEKLTPVSNIIGVIILTVGVLSLLGAVLQLFLLRFVILSNILPQVSAIAVGLFLGKEILMRKPKLEKISEFSDSDAAKKTEELAGNAVAKTQELLSKYDDKIALLEKYQVKIGLACIVLGVLHLFLSGLPLI